MNLTFNRVSPPRPSIENLKILLEQIVQLAKYDGTLELYLNDLQTGQEVHFAYDQGQLVRPDIAFTAASTMKIPIMTSVFLREPDPLPQDVSDQIGLMIEYSENGPADNLMETVLDQMTGPLMVTEDMQTIGLENTFLGGYFYPGAPLIEGFQNPSQPARRISPPNRISTTRPLRPRWGCCWRIFTTARKKAVERSRRSSPARCRRMNASR